jgi:hypothetical protein
MPTPLRSLALLVLLAATSTAQGETGFLRGRGHLDVATSYSVETFEDVQLENPVERFEDGRVEVVGLYAAYGLRDDLDLVLRAAHVASSADGEPAFEDESDLQDVSVQAKWRLHEQPLGPGQLSLLVMPGIRAPLTDYPDRSVNPLNGLGTGDTVLLGRVIAHYGQGSSYLAFETGYDRHNGPLDDEIPLFLSGGTTVGRVTYQAFLSSIYALGDTISHPRLSDERDGYLRAGLGAYIRANDAFGLSVSVFGSDDGENSGKGASLGVVFRR